MLNSIIWIIFVLVITSTDHNDKGNFKFQCRWRNLIIYAEYYTTILFLSDDVSHYKLIKNG